MNLTRISADAERDRRYRRQALKTCLQQYPHPHTEFEPGILHHGNTASVVLFPVGQTLTLFKSIYRTLHEDALPPPSAQSGMGKFGTARPEVESFKPHLSLTSSMSLMEATAMLARIRRQMREAAAGFGPSLLVPPPFHATSETSFLSTLTYPPGQAMGCRPGQRFCTR